MISHLPIIHFFKSLYLVIKTVVIKKISKSQKMFPGLSELFDIFNFRKSIYNNNI